jgi:hypothetical protein
VTVELRRSEARSRVLVIVKKRSIASDHAVDLMNVARSVSPSSLTIYKTFFQAAVLLMEAVTRSVRVEFMSYLLCRNKGFV